MRQRITSLNLICENFRLRCESHPKAEPMIGCQLPSHLFTCQCCVEGEANEGIDPKLFGVIIEPIVSLNGKTPKKGSELKTSVGQ